jgi:3'-phosphoadenosine 5'-phosphosulfate sulfotransferase (PAPS reductase)/FAD synthetase
METTSMFPELVMSPQQAIKEAFKDVDKRLEQGAHLVISVSGGKDSDAMMWYLKNYWKPHFTGSVSLLHADLFESERTETAEYVRGMSERSGIPLYIVQKNDTSGLVEQIIWRMISRPDAPPFPSAAMRYCTSDMKTGPCDIFVRNKFKRDADVIVAIGIRAAESVSRSKKPPYTERPLCSSTQKNRRVSTLFPLFDWSTERIYDYLKPYGMHPAYSLGNERLSCAICVLGSLNDIMNGIENKPEVYQMLCSIEAMSGYTFTDKIRLMDLRPDLLPDRIKYYDHKLYEPPTFEFAYEFSGLKAYNEKHVLS